MAECKQCGGVVTGDEIGLTKKLINRGAEEFMCVDCLAAYFRVTPDLLREKIEQYRSMGCTLFASK